MADLTLRLLGPFEASSAGSTLNDFRTKKAQALLIYLAVLAQPQKRDHLMSLLWPGMPERSARSNLRQVLYLLRQAVPDATGNGGSSAPFLVANRQIIALNPSAPVAVDVHHFETRLEHSASHKHLDLYQCPDCRRYLEQAVGFYRGEFLTDFYLDDSDVYEEWAHDRRAYYRRRALEALSTLTEMSMQARAYPNALELAERQLQIDDLSETAYRQKIKSLALDGRRREALKIYEECRRMLLQELGMAPAARTTELIEQIRSGEPLGATPARGVRGYELKELIEVGASGAIHRAVQNAVGREVAVKVIRRDHASDPDFIRRFEAEAEIVARLEHPHIVPLYDFWREPDGAYLVMRYLRAGSLLKALEGGAWHPERTLRLVEQIGSALEAAHSQGVIHRDIKPGNILLDEAGNAYLSDFGIAKDHGGSMPHTTDMQVKGTLDYISPEQIMNEPVTPQSDIYSLGAVLYETLTGEKPFGDASVANLIYSQLHEPIPFVTTSRRDVPPEVDAVLQKATAKRQADRFESVTEMVNAYARAVSGEQDTRALPITVPRPAKEVYNPYKGLRAFQEADADDFFGRDTLVQQLVNRLGQATTGDGEMSATSARFLAVVGPSGSGKSSAVRAGLIPALRSGALPGSETWFIAQMMPGDNPLEELQAALWPIAVDPPPDLVAPMQRDTGGLLRTLRRILPRERVKNQEPQLLLVIDQFEELYTLVAEDERRAFFIDSLLKAIAAPRSPLRLVITLRADFFDRPLQQPDLGRLLKNHAEVVLPLNRAELTWAIREPARRVGARLEEGLVGVIVGDAGDQPGALPLLQHALAELFDRRSGDLITHADYKAIGGVQGALGRRAEALYNGLEPSERTAARQLFLRLVSLGEGSDDTRRRVLRSELEALQSNGEATGHAVPTVVETFGRARLLTFDRDPVTRQSTVEVAHEALLREWRRLDSWLDASRADVRLQRLLAGFLAEWEAAGRDDGFLLRGSRLNQFAGWMDDTSVGLTGAERAFLSASLAARQERQAVEETRRQREVETARRLAESERRRADEEARAAATLRRRAAYLGGALLVAAILAVTAVLLSRSAATSASDARQEADTRATAEAIALVERDRAAAEAEARATQEAIAINERDRAAAQTDLARAAEATAQAETAVRAAAEAEAGREREIAQGQAVLATARELAAMALVVLEEDAERSILLALRSLDLNYTPEGEAVLRQAMMASRLRVTIPGTQENLGYVMYAPDGATLIGVEDDGTNGFVTYWNANSGDVLRTFSCGPVCVGGVVSSDGRLLAAVDDESIINVVDLSGSLRSDTVRIVHQIEAPSGTSRDPGAITFSPDGTRLATVSWDEKSLDVWDLVEGRLLFSRTAALQWIFTSPAFSPDGAMLAVSGFVPTVAIGARILDSTTGDLLLEFPADQRWPVFLADGRRLATHSWTDREIHVWDLEQSLATGNPQEVYSFDLASDQAPGFHVASPDSTLLTEDFAGDTTLWRMGPDGATMAMVLTGHDPQFDLNQVFHPNGKRLATVGNDGIRIWDITAAGQRELLSIEAHSNNTFFLDLSHDGALLATGSWDDTARLWDAATGELLREFVGHAADLKYVSFSPDGTRLLTSSEDRTVRVWDTATGEELAVLIAAEPGYDIGAVYTGAMSGRYSPDGRKIVTGGVDGTVRVYDAASFELLQSVVINPREELPPRGVTLALFSPDSTLLAAATEGSEDGLVRVWNVATGEIVLEEVIGPRVFGLDFSPDGTRLALSTCCVGLGQVWDLEAGEKVLDLDLPEATIPEIYFSQDGERLIAKVTDSIVFWDANSGERVRTLFVGSNWNFAITRDESRVYIGRDDGLVRAFVVDVDELIALAESRLTRRLREEECRQYLHLDSCPAE